MKASVEAFFTLLRQHKLAAVIQNDSNTAEANVNIRLKEHVFASMLLSLCGFNLILYTVRCTLLREHHAQLKPQYGEQVKKELSCLQLSELTFAKQEPNKTEALRASTNNLRL